jgi:hypothetical protein
MMALPPPADQHTHTHTRRSNVSAHAPALAGGLHVDGHVLQLLGGRQRRVQSVDGLRKLDAEDGFARLLLLLLRNPAVSTHPHTHAYGSPCAP